MFKSAARAFFGSRNDRLIKRLRKRVAEINALEPSIAALTDAELAGKTVEISNASPAAKRWTACCPKPLRSSAKPRTASWANVPMTCSLIGVCLHEGRIPEMRTGEGKTLVGTLPVYLNALTGKACISRHVNDCLAKRRRMDGPRL